MNVADLPKWLAGHRPPPAKLCAVLQGGREQRLAMGVNSQRWTRITNALASMNAEGVALYNGADELLDRADIEYDTGKKDDAAPAAKPVVEPISILKDASDVNALVHALAQAFSTVVINTTDACAKSGEAAFKELREVNKIQADLIKSLRQQNEDSMAAREDAIEEREQQHEEKKNGDAMMNQLINIAGPEVVKKIGEKIFAAAPAAAPAVTNGATSPTTPKE